MTTADLSGYIAATLTTVAFIPQAWLTRTRRKTEGVSRGMYVIYTAGVATRLCYGTLMNSGPIILAKVFTLIPALCILVMKVRFV